jgi:subtilisin family serine protease
MAAALLACAGVVLAQETASPDRPFSTPRQPAKSNVIPGRYIVVLKDDDGGRAGAQAVADERQARQVAKDLSEDNKVEEISQTYGAALKGFAAEIPAGKVDAVRSDPRVAYVAKDREVHASAQTRPTGIKRADADVSSVLAGNGSGAVNADIAILDSGIYTKHPDLNVAGGKDCSQDGKSTFSDDDGHGSHVAGTAAAKDNASGLVGTAPGARLWAVKVIKADGSGSWRDIICGIDWVTQNAGVIEAANMSLGSFVGPGADDGNCGLRNGDPVHQAICDSVNDAKVTYVVAAGNEFEDVKDYIPASYDEVITVSALADYNGRPGGGASNSCNQDRATDDDFAFFSNYATFAADEAHMLGAPGVCIRSTWKGIKKRTRNGTKIVPGYKTISGTSTASPHVAGAAAVYVANQVANQNPRPRPDQVKSFMLAPANTEAVNEGHTDIYGYNPEPVLQMDNY